MIKFGSFTFPAEEFAYMEVWFLDPEKSKIIEEYPYGLNVHLKCGGKCCMKYKYEPDRNMEYRRIANAVDEELNHKKEIGELKKEIADLKEGLLSQLKDLRYRMNDLTAEEPNAVSETDPISILQLSNRSENCLHRGGIKTIGDLRSAGRNGIGRLRNLGRKSIKEIDEMLIQKTGRGL